MYLYLNFSTVLKTHNNNFKIAQIKPVEFNLNMHRSNYRKDRVHFELVNSGESDNDNIKQYK